MYNLVYGDQEDQKTFEKKFGRYNDAPPNLKEITQDEFFHVLSTYSPEQQAYKQVMDDPRFDPVMNLHMYIYSDGSGVAFTTEWLPEKGLGVWEQKFYSFAVCEHNYEVTLSRMCYSELRCTKCGHQTSIDSSG